MGNSSSSTGENQYLVNVRGRCTEDAQAQIRAAVGCELGPYMRLPDYGSAYLVWATEEAVEAAGELGCVSKVGLYEGKYKAGQLHIENLDDDEVVHLVVKVDYAHTAADVMEEWTQEGREHDCSDVKAVSDDKIEFTVDGKHVGDVVTWLRHEPHCHYIERKATYRLM